MKKFFKEWVVPALLAFAIVMFIFRFIFILPSVPSGSMIPTIMVGDRLYVNRLIDTDKIERGDIIVFNSDEYKHKLIKRVIGLPGESVEVKKNGDVYINGEKLDEPYAVPVNGIEKKFDIPDDCFLFFGDNRPSSEDARYWKNPYIKSDQIIGKAVFRIFPFTRIGKIE